MPRGDDQQTSMRKPLRFLYKGRVITQRGTAFCVGRKCFRSKEEALAYVDWHF